MATFSRVWTVNSPNSRRDPGDAKYKTGWVSEIPTYQVLNFLQWKNDTTILSIAERGIPEWGGDIRYNKNALVYDNVTSKIYVSLVDNPNAGKTPGTNPTQWSLSAIGVPRTDYDNAKAAWQAHIANVTTNPHKITAALLNAYTKTETDQILTTYRGLVSAHANNTNNPHKTKAVDIGAVPVEGGKYTGPVTFDTGSVLLDDAGTAKVLKDSLGVWLANGNGRLGLRSGSAAVPMVGTDAALSRIITDLSFSDYKQQIEPQYSVPTPQFQMNCIRDANLQIGPGVWDASWDIQFADDTGWMILDVNAVRRDYLATINPIAEAREATIMCRMRFRGPPAMNGGPPGNRQVIGIGGPTATGSRLIFVFNRVSAGSRYCTVYSGDNGNIATNTYQMGDAANHVIVGVRRMDRIEFWLDGVLIDTKMTPNTIPIRGLGNGISCSPVADTGDEPRLEISDFRMWNRALTKEQISTL